MMENANGYSLSDIKAVADGENGFGTGNGFFWIIVLFIFLFAFNGNGFGGFGGNNGVGKEFIQRDLFNMQQAQANCCCDTQKSILENRYVNQLGLQNLGQQASNCCCENLRAIDGVKSEAYRNTCDITTAIHAEGEQTRALITANTMQELRDKLADKDRDLLVAELAFRGDQNVNRVIGQLQPTPKPAYLTCSPFGNSNPYNPYAPFVDCHGNV